MLREMQPATNQKNMSEGNKRNPNQHNPMGVMQTVDEADIPSRMSHCISLGLDITHQVGVQGLPSSFKRERTTTPDS